MAANAPIPATADMFRNEPFVTWFRIYSSETVVLSAAAVAGATSLTILPLRRALANGVRIFFPDIGFSVKLGAGAAVGATALTVTATAGPLPGGAQGRRVLDASSYTLSWTLETKAPQTVSVLLTKTPTMVDDDGDPDATPFKLAQVSKLSTDLATTVPGVYVQRLVRTDTGRCLAQGDVVLKVR